MVKEQDNSYHKSNINWFPGHMAKTRRQIEEDIKIIDVVVEILDARIPIASQNPEIRKITANKKRIIVLNKSDLADEKENEKWQSKFIQEGIPASIINANTGEGIHKIIKQIEEIMQEGKKQLEEKGRIGKSIRVMILGIPNVGKSSVINRIAKRSTAEVGNKPGVTKAKQWIKVNDKIELLDTPGVLWPKIENQETALHLAYTGSIKDEILDKVEIAYQLLKYLLENYREAVEARYKIAKEKIEEILGQEENAENENIYEIMQLIGKQRGAIASGGKINIEKTSQIIIEDFRSGKIGRITIEKAI